MGRIRRFGSGGTLIEAGPSAVIRWRGGLAESGQL